ncbi:F-box domain-containing protein [Colletotrichum sublineola]|uniref:Putative F-box domain-containing protein n=1 Tax=Colletotrichum sublineola TaxID=1173701 RepID=A0A066XJH3_COLSU|nr:F-box domain-containing protein [Colletotrichum sublineola]KDN67804.1 putative F-box domain-containing protein [Colletotrichum sublineola]
MVDQPPPLDSELESFRQQWRSELKTKKTVLEPQASQIKKKASSFSKPSAPGESSRAVVPKRPQVEEDEEYACSLVFDEPAPSPSTSMSNLEEHGPSQAKELLSALDYFEEAVEKEAIGSLGDSLKLYRKAFRMDSRVDLAYRKKHFPSAAAKPSQPSASSALSAAGKPPETQQQTMSELIASFAGLSVAVAPPPVEGDPTPPCPVAEMPQEILVHIFKDVAVLDVGDFVRLSLVCRRFAYIVATEQQIWRRICLGSEFGFAGMHYHWQRGVFWEPLEQEGDTEDLEYVSMEELAQRRREESETTTLALLSEIYSSSWQSMFRHRPRIRFNGCYISTVNYVRPGQADANQITWNTPVHIVTYYRYLRFFRDGTVISLLTTDEPASVVHYITRDLLKQHRGGGAAHLPSLVMQYGLRGRWRMSSALDHPDVPLGETENDLFIETEGVGAKYTYRMHLEVRNAGRSKGARNTKLMWKGFYSYNKVTDDLGEFGLKNSKSFFFSRVKSYGVGE